MAYREVRMMDIDQVIRRWLAGERIRAIARATGSDRNTVRRIVRLAGEVGIRQETPWPDEGKLQALRQRMGRPGAAVAAGEAEQRLKPRTEQIRTWLDKDHLLLTKVHELLGREGLVVSYSALYRFARKWCEFGSAASITVRRAECQAGEMAEADFGRLGLLQELGNRLPRAVQGFILTLGYSRLSCVIPVFKQDLPTVIDCFECALAFFGGCPRRIVIDGMKACLDQTDLYTPRFNRTFLEYANYRGFLPDPARPVHPKDKPVVENQVRYVRERFFKGETFIDLDDVARRALAWCREVAGRRLHGTTRRVPLEVFEAEERPHLVPLRTERFETPTWGQCKVHPDHHIRFGQALYSVPTRWIGCPVEVRGDRSLVRIYAHGELIKTHERKPPGGRSTDYTDYPEGRAPYARRWPDYYRKRARDLGSANCVAHHARCYGHQQQILELEHYLDVLWRKPGALAGSTALDQQRQAGLWPASFDRIWQALMARQGKQNGTRQMVGLLKLGQQYGRGKLQESVETALAAGCSDAAAVEHLLRQDELRRNGCEAVDVGALERYARPLPVMTEYDQLLTLGGAR